MARIRTTFNCSECGWSSPKWLGQCKSCQAWGTLEELGGEEQVRDPVARAVAASTKPSQAALPIAQVEITHTRTWSTGVSEMDRVLGGGIVPGAVILLAGEPGVGKSTLLLDVAARAAKGTLIAEGGFDIPGSNGDGLDPFTQKRLSGLAHKVADEVVSTDIAAENVLDTQEDETRDPTASPLLRLVPSTQTGPSPSPLETEAKDADARNNSRDMHPSALRPPQTVLYLTGEESAAQVRLRAQRIGALAPTLLIASEHDTTQVAAQVATTNPSLLIIDSVQTFTNPEVDGQAGGVSQVRAVASSLIAIAKERSIPVILVGHVTKDGGLAGPRVLEHLVDVVCVIEGERHSRLRLLRAVKNRYGPTDEVGCFELSEKGIIGLPDPSGLFLSHTGKNVPGTCVTVTLEGQRPMPTEIQALVATSGGGSPRRTTSGLDSSRLAMIVAILQSRAGIDVSANDVYVSTVGGAKTTEPAVDLALALAIASSYAGKSLRPGLIALGEVSLSGEVRPAIGVQRRLSEAARLGFTTSIVPAQGAAEIAAPENIEIIPVLDLASAVHFALEKISEGD